ncbi:MAG: hypothetical protein ACKOB2_07350, partial [Solirubrobacterales bacterium]
GALHLALVRSVLLPTLALGVACGAESTQHFGAGIVDPHEAERLASEVELEEVGSPASTI